MQIHVAFSPDRPLTIPMAYQYQLQSAIYRKLSRGGAGDWHDGGFAINDGQSYKAFCFGRLRGGYTVENRTYLRFTDTFSLEVRSPVFDFCDALQRALELSPRMKLFDTELNVSAARLMNVHIFSQTARFAAETPIVVSRRLPNGETEYFSPEEDRFFTGLCANYTGKYEAVTGEPAPELRLRPVSAFKKSVTKYKGIWVTGWRGELEVNAPPAALEFLYNTGLGEKNAQGFGFLKLRDS